MVRLQAALGAQGVRRGADAPRAVRSHLEARHRAVQQVSNNFFYFLHTVVEMVTLPAQEPISHD
ncbi:hypothetical protein FOCC_FOCC004092 [Frankliniella occidentalis]|nr:hypothetical protein FOCC_FOCC004092 [Frankliniella occidentalis]